MKKWRIRHFVSRITGYVLVGGILFFVLLPIFWMVSTSVRPIHHIYSVPPIWISNLSSFRPYIDMWNSRPFPLYFRNTLIVAGISTVVSAVLANFAAYGFSRFKFRGSNLVLSAVLATQMFPIILIVIPYFRMMVSADLIDTHLSLIIAYVSFTLPFCIWTLKGFYDGIPKELDESSLIDGCSRTQAFLRVIIPLAKPGLSTTIIFAFLTAWNHYTFAMILTTSPANYVISTAIPSLMSQYSIQWNQLMAAATVAILPPIIIYVLLQRFFISGLTSGAVKG